MVIVIGSVAGPAIKMQTVVGVVTVVRCCVSVCEGDP